MCVCVCVCARAAQWSLTGGWALARGCRPVHLNTSPPHTYQTHTHTHTRVHARSLLCVMVCAGDGWMERPSLRCSIQSWQERPPHGYWARSLCENAVLSPSECLCVWALVTDDRDANKRARRQWKRNALTEREIWTNRCAHPSIHPAVKLSFYALRKSARKWPSDKPCTALEVVETPHHSTDTNTHTHTPAHPSIHPSTHPSGRHAKATSLPSPPLSELNTGKICHTHTTKTQREGET